MTFINVTDSDYYSSYHAKAMIMTLLVALIAGK